MTTIKNNTAPQAPEKATFDSDTLVWTLYGLGFFWGFLVVFYMTWGKFFTENRITEFEKAYWLLTIGPLLGLIFLCIGCIKSYYGLLKRRFTKHTIISLLLSSPTLLFLYTAIWALLHGGV